MAHYAFLDRNKFVVSVIKGIDETELIDGKTPEEWYSDFKGMPCVRTSYNGNIRKQYAGVGFYYDANADVFIAPKPFDSWLLDENFDWQAPEPRPDGDFWSWDEELGEWINVEPTEA